MKIAKIRIANILGVKELEFEAGKFNEVTGKNGLGKTSIIEALKGVFKSGNDVTLIRNDDDVSKGEIGIELSDGTTIEKSFANKATLEIKDPFGKQIKSPSTYLEKITDLMSTNPIDFLTADKKSRTNLLLETLPLKLDKEQLEGIDKIYYESLNVQFMHALEAIAKIHKFIYDDRTGVNRVLKDKNAVVNDLQVKLNDVNFDPSIDYSSKIAELENIKSQMEDKIRLIVDDLNNKKLEELQKVQANYLDVANSIEQDYQAELSKLRADRDSKLDKARANMETSKAGINSEADNHITERQTAFNDRYQPLLAEISEYSGQHKLQAGYNAQNDFLNKAVAEREELIEKVESLNKQLNILEDVKNSLLSGLPISGLEIIDGQIYRDGVIFDRLNTAQKIDIAIEIAKLRAGELGVVCVDGLESFDSENYELFKEKMSQTNLQLFVSKVGDEPLAINGQNINVN